MNMPDKFDEQKLVNAPWLFADYFDWSFLKEHGTKIQYKRGTTMQSADIADSVFYLHTGRVRISTFNDEGEEKIILLVNRGNLFNVGALAGDIPDYQCYTIVTDSVVYKISKDVFINLVKNDSEKAINVITDLSRMVKILSSHVGDMAFMRAPSRVAKYLYMLCQEQGTPTKNGIRINIKFTHYEMAIYVGTCRVTVSNILKEMERNKIISKENGYCVVNDVEKLKECIMYL